MVKRSSIVLRQPSRILPATPSCGSPPIEWHSPAVLEYPFQPRRNLPGFTSLFWATIYLRPGSGSTAVPLGHFGPKPDGCIYSLHPGCHTFGNTRPRLLSIGFPMGKTSSKVSFVASHSGVPRKTTCPLFVVAPVVGSRYLYHRRCS